VESTQHDVKASLYAPLRVLVYEHGGSCRYLPHLPPA
jgi:hypothetical protein